ncbi:trafficking protein particle complex subunit 2-like protein [Cavenderia fasciculata]|uniref:Trafficking protein particle complex subunit 2-like protein n=1 Tax=Cavenderia fasciculata TaxID=261658 RepID=F4QBC4_CACFS|nr:trafficking protein particle complex subunit 2-like protein [Cavenderia fasciculata]EGG14896.1 trafficking protein particle complex subunit 2-like protein [Cavenderia fasciculata]|eukprot:XP_004351412.1 trafficking protein particle complex subunit 2-like protein [Cavenderia fasciculata]
MKKIVCVAVVGKVNDPLFIHDYSGGSEENRLKLNYIVHCSLDIIEEKPGAKKVGNDMYLGLLYPTEDYKVYGYLTNTKIKFIIVVMDSTDIKDNDIRQFFKKLHVLYVQTTSSTFYKPNSKIESNKFLNNVTTIVQTL